MQMQPSTLGVGTPANSEAHARSPTGGTRQRHAASASPQFRGVNIGGWLVLESWITPSLYNAYNVSSGAGEWQFCQQLGPDTARHALEGHWDTWVTIGHLQTLKDAGVTHLRVPIGYWIMGPPYLLPDEPYLTGGFFYLQRLLGWAASLHLQVIVDLHGAPGSQNGHDNSGRTGSIDWDTPQNINRTIAVLTALAANLTILQSQPQYAGAIAGIELLNEPWTTAIGGPIPMETLKDFYQNATDSILATGFVGDIWFSDGWNLSWSEWAGFLPPPQYQNIYIDTHIYTCFGGFDTFTQWQLIQQMCTVQLPRLHNQDNTDWIIVGEYSVCNPKEPTTFPYGPDDNMFMRAFGESQLQAYGAVGPNYGGVKGAFFWNFRTEDSPSWDYLQGLQSGYIANLTSALPGSSLDCSVFATP